MAAHAKFLSFAILCATGIAGIAAAVVWHRTVPAPVLTGGALLRPDRALADFSLIDQQGKVFGSAELRGRWSLLFFGYTNCPDFCPTTLAALADMKKRLRAAQAKVLPQVIFVSVDAERDTPAQLSKYVPYFDPDFIGLTGADQPSIEAVAKQLGVGVIIRPTSAGDYIVEHSDVIFVINPDGRIAAILTGPFNVEALQADFQRIVAARGSPAGRA